MGRRGAVDLKYEEDAKARQLTFAKRSQGLKKMAHELSVLCDVEVLLIWYDRSGKASAWPDDDSRIKKTISKYQDIGKERQSKYKVDSLGFFKGQKDKFQSNVIQQSVPEHLAQLLDCKIEEVRRRIEVLESQKSSEVQPVYASPLDCHFADKSVYSSMDLFATNKIGCQPYGLFYSQEMPNTFCYDTSQLVKSTLQVHSSDYRNPQLEYCDYPMFPSVDPVSDDYYTGSMVNSFSRTDNGPSWSSLPPLADVSTCEDMDSENHGTIPQENSCRGSDICPLGSLAPPLYSSAYLNEMDTSSIALLRRECSLGDVEDSISCHSSGLHSGSLLAWSSLAPVALDLTREGINGNGLAVTPQESATLSTDGSQYHCLDDAAKYCLWNVGAKDTVLTDSFNGILSTTENGSSEGLETTSGIYSDELWQFDDNLGTIPQENSRLGNDICPLSSLAPPLNSSAYLNEMDTSSFAFLRRESSLQDVEDSTLCHSSDLHSGSLSALRSLAPVALDPTCEGAYGNDLAVSPKESATLSPDGYQDHCLEDATECCLWKFGAKDAVLTDSFHGILSTTENDSSEGLETTFDIFSDKLWQFDDAIFIL